ncbi:MAG: hypothetical protein Q4F31_05285 [Eubacteriales bacterium]|nr:hypothetical protein [Eubacteriales bacterium]
MKRILRKLKNTSGETLAETLVSVLIVSLASVVLAAMIGAASRMNIKAKNYDKELDNAILAMASEGGAQDSLSVILGNDSADPVKYTVNYKTSTGNLKLSSYSIPATPAESSAGA